MAHQSSGSSVIRRTISTTLSTVHQGVAFEKRSLRLLEENLSMSLRHVGGKSDGGIDLQGWWWLPEVALCLRSQSSIARHEQARRMRIRVLAQCKDEKKKLSPKYVRELEGVLFRYTARSSYGELSLSLRSTAPVDARTAESGLSPLDDGQDWSADDAENTSSPLVGLLISSSPFTKATLLRAHSSPVPLALLHIPSLSVPLSLTTVDQELHQERGEDANVVDSAHEIGSLVFNPALGSTSGLLRGRVQPRWERSLSGTGLSGRPGLWCDGQRLRSWTPKI
ncbi:hypothetical protein BKA93DRAFT_189869 [Sparassis latifolia]|uniref:Uncharacterized protein n=1 Tax=Sparassis crispa TaxID=139825 RepID=A0A401GZI3_9APHY|nr:predicted protein [Sparassis crispa]GBE87560.1 predicted protein [Sparassis crispa]